MEPRYLTTIAAAVYLGLSAKTLANWRSEARRTGKLIGPRWVERGRIIRYAVAELDAWLATFAIVEAGALTLNAGDANPAI